MAASVLFVAIHANFGLHVLKRGVIFVDLALAQMSALGATIAFASGHLPTSTSGLVYTFLFSAMGAVLLTAGRGLPKVIHTEAYIGILYVVATAATIIVVDRSPQGAEHVKQILVGSILTVSASELPKFVILYGAIGTFHWLARRPLRVTSEAAAAGHGRTSLSWDFLFYLSFGAVVTSSVATAGVLLVFCFLIIPALIGSLFAHRFEGALAVGWVSGAGASVIGLAASFEFDLPAGAAMVLAFAFALAIAVILRACVSVPREQRKYRFRSLIRGISVATLSTVSAAMIWLMAVPGAGQPLLDVLEGVIGIGPQTFLTRDEREVYAHALTQVRLRQSQAAEMTDFERRSRWQGEPLSDDAVRRIGSFQQAFNEMARGEDFVIRSMATRARERERWYLGPALLAAALLGLVAVTPSELRARVLRRSGWRHVARTLGRSSAQS